MTHRAGVPHEPGVTQSGPQRLLDRHDALLVDLDGVVYLGDQVVEAAPEALGAARAAGVAVRFVTNNAARTAAQVAAAITRLGVAADAAEVVTSSQVAARVLAERFGAGAAVLAVGGDGLREPLAAAGLRVVTSADDAPVAVAQGWAPEVGWPMLAEAAVAIRAGAAWIATNLDPTLPSPRGPLPGNGSMLAPVAIATGRAPESVGKPAPAMFEQARTSAKASRPLVVGDRLETDVAGAAAAGMQSLAVLSGVSAPADLLAAAPDARPTYIGRDLATVLAPPMIATVDCRGERAECCGVVVDSDGGVEAPSDDRHAPVDIAIAGLIAACALAWTGRLPSARYEQVLGRLDFG